MNTSPENLTKKGLSAAKYTVIFRIAAQCVGLLATICLVRLFSEHDYGIYNLLYSFIALMSMLFSFGIANTLQRYMPEYYSRGEYTIAHRLYRISALIRLLSNMSVLGFILLFWDYLSPLLKVAEYKPYFILFTLIVVLHLQRVILETCLNSYFLHKNTQGISFIFTIIKGVGYFLALLASWDLWFVLGVDLIAYILTFGYLEFVYYKKIPKQGGTFQKIPILERKRLLKYSLYYNFNDAGVGFLDANFDNFILVMFLNPVAVGAYAFCNKIIKMTGNLSPISYLQHVIRTILFHQQKTDNHSQHSHSFQMLLKIVYSFQIPLFCIFALFSHEIIETIFGGKFLIYSNILTAVAFFSLLNAFQMPVGIIAQLYERADIILYSKCFAAYNLIADLILIQYFGIWGAVIATGTATFGKNLFIWYFIRENTSLDGLSYFFFRLLGYWGFVSSFAYWLTLYIDSAMIVLFIGGACIVAGFVLQFRFLHLSDKDKLFLINIEKESSKISKIFRLCGLSYSEIKL